MPGQRKTIYVTAEYDDSVYDIFLCGGDHLKRAICLTVGAVIAATGIAYTKSIYEIRHLTLFN